MRLNIPAILALIGFCSLGLGLLCSSLIFPKLTTHLIKRATELTEGSKTFESWKKIPFPFKLKVYFFNVTNPEDVQEGSKPILKEMGPYVYDEFREREVLLINEENDTIKYIQRKNYFFNGEESGCRTEDDIVTIIHFPILNMADKVNKISSAVLPMLNDALPFLYPNLKNVFITDSVRNILFEGIKISCEGEETDLICGGLRSKLPHTIRIADNDRDFLLSFFHHMNDTIDGPYEIGRGLNGTIKGEVKSFKENNELTQWGSRKCNEIKGTDLTINPNMEEEPQRINFFAPDFCRYFSVKFQEEIEYRELQTYYFKTQNLFERAKCFCQDQNDMLLECPPNGTMDLSSCTGSPIILSQPHFLHAEKSLLESVRGLKPSEDKHGTFIIMEPKTGLALKVKTRFQMSIFLKQYDDVDILRNVTEVYFPFMWLENSADIPRNIIEDVQNNFNKLKIFDIIKYILIGVGVILLGISLIFAIVKDKIVCLISRTNTVSVKTNDQNGRLMDMYSNSKVNNGAIIQASNNMMGRYPTKIIA